METEANASREEGELSDDSDQYTPLERPATYSATAVPTNRFSKIIESESDEEPLQSSSDSDSDVATKSRPKPKKSRLTIKPKLALAANPKRKRYDIWSTRMQEDVLSETLNCCDVSLKDRSRDVESYDYTLSYSFRQSGEGPTPGAGPTPAVAFKDSRTNNKRTRNDRKNHNLRLKQNRDEEGRDGRGAPRAIIDLAVTLQDSLEDVVKDIANKLCEEKDDLIRSIVSIAGKETAFKVFKEVQKIEKEGGMLIMNQTRRRTPGGVYFFLIKHDTDLTRDQHNEIFGDATEKFRKDQKDRTKKRRKEIKAQIVAQRKSKELPELLTRAELCVQKLVSITDRTRKESSHEDVINPPPTPETDGHENDNSGDGMDNFSNLPSIVNGQDALGPRKLEAYEDDFLDMTAGTEMDLF